MTLQQLKYVITVAETGTITEAAKKLYISQPSLTNAIHDLEKEMNVEIFHRTNKGIDISKEGEDFLGYARQVLEQAAKYIPLERLYLSPQCGFASCEIGNKLTEEEQWAKLKLVKEIAEEVWG